MKKHQYLWYPVDQPPSWWPAACSSQPSTISSKTSTTTRSNLLSPSWRPAAYCSRAPASSSLTSPTTRPQLLPPSWQPATCSFWPPAGGSLTSDQPYYLAAAPASILTASSLLFQPSPTPFSFSSSHHRPQTKKLTNRRNRREGGIY